MNEGRGAWGGEGSVQDWHDPSTWLSAAASAGEGNGGADKVGAPTESIEPTALHLSRDGGWAGYYME